jgi:diguanylate cyclase (GGDEF)-like protein
VSSPPAQVVEAPASARGRVRAGWRRRLDEAPLRIKVALLLLTGVVWGAVIGMAVAEFDYALWLGAAAVASLVFALVGLAMRWIWAPVEQLLDKAQRMARPDRPLPARSLPVHRRDEIGQLARVLQQLTIAARREQSEAKRLRRTLDHEVEQATRRATHHLQQLAMRDPLTGLANRRFLDQQLGAVLRSCRATGTELVCVMIDVDNFKAVNDQLGHSIGDQLLVFIAQLIRAMVRGDDLSVRLGGDEFVVIMPGGTTRRADEFARQARQLFHEHARTVLPRQLHCGLSVGVSAAQVDDAQTVQQLLEQADRRMYQQKRANHEPTD